MADIFYDNASGSDADDGSTRALAKQTLAAALTAAGAGGRVFAKNDSAESTAGSITLQSPGTAASPTQLLSCDWTSDTPDSNALQAGASVTVTGNVTLSMNGHAYAYGMTFQKGATSAGTFQFCGDNTSLGWTLEECVLKTASGLATTINFGAGLAVNIDDQILTLINTDFELNSTGTINVRCRVVWRGGAITGTTTPTTLFTLTSPPCELFLSGVDLSSYGSGENLISVASAQTTRWHLENCKLGSSVSVTTGSVAGPGGATGQLVNCDSADTNYRYHKQDYCGTITQETTIVRTGGASDGTTPISRKMVSTANSKFYSPLISDPVIVWNDTPGSYTATIEVVTDNVTLTDAEAWAEVEYLGTSGFPLSLFASDRATNILSTPANQTTSSETWTTTGLATPVKQKLAVAFTTAEKGPVAVRVHLAKASTTMYFCPKVDVT